MKLRCLKWEHFKSKLMGILQVTSFQLKNHVIKIILRSIWINRAKKTVYSSVDFANQTNNLILKCLLSNLMLSYYVYAYYVYKLCVCYAGFSWEFAALNSGKSQICSNSLEIIAKPYMETTDFAVKQAWPSYSPFSQETVSTSTVSPLVPGVQARPRQTEAFSAVKLDGAGGPMGKARCPRKRARPVLEGLRADTLARGSDVSGNRSVSFWRRLVMVWMMVFQVGS